MEFYDVIKTRQSVRSYSSREVEQEKLERILYSASRAPSWQNQQCVRFIVVSSPQAREKLVDCSPAWNQKTLSEAPVSVIACAQPSESGVVEDQKYYLVDAAIAMQNLVLAATAEGLGTCWQAPRAEEDLRRAFGIPADYRVVAVTPLGYASEQPEKTERISPGELAFKDNWGEPAL